MHKKLALIATCGVLFLTGCNTNLFPDETAEELPVEVIEEIGKVDESTVSGNTSVEDSIEDSEHEHEDDVNSVSLNSIPIQARVVPEGFEYEDLELKDIYYKTTEVTDVMIRTEESDSATLTKSNFIVSVPSNYFIYYSNTAPYWNVTDSEEGFMEEMLVSDFTDYLNVKNASLCGFNLISESNVFNRSDVTVSSNIPISSFRFDGVKLRDDKTAESYIKQYYPEVTELSEYEGYLYWLGDTKSVVYVPHSDGCSGLLIAYEGWCDEYFTGEEITDFLKSVIVEHNYEQFEGDTEVTKYYGTNVSNGIFLGVDETITTKLVDEYRNFDGSFKVTLPKRKDYVFDVMTSNGRYESDLDTFDDGFTSDDIYKKFEENESGVCFVQISAPYILESNLLIKCSSLIEESLSGLPFNMYENFTYNGKTVYYKCQSGEDVENFFHVRYMIDNACQVEFLWRGEFGILFADYVGEENLAKSLCDLVE